MNKRELWVDNVKAFACILVVFGHFFQSMIKASILPTNEFYGWFNTTIYYFHVPLFFICSGYVYQRYSQTNHLKLWFNNVVKKAIVLGIPFFCFSLITWLLKTVFSDSVNDDVGNILDVLFIHPIAPYWYLYVLFFCFIISPTMNKRVGIVVLLAVSIGFKMLALFLDGIENSYIADKVFNNWIWFVIGMTLGFVGVHRISCKKLGVILGVSFIALSALLYSNSSVIIGFLLGLVACAAVVMIIANYEHVPVLTYLSKYTMPIFLMHTLFAAPIRSLLIKVGITNAFLHVLIGLFISFIGPIIAMKIMSILHLDFIVYPGRLLKKNKTVKPIVK